VQVDAQDPDLPGGVFAMVAGHSVSLAAGQDFLNADFPFRSGLVKSSSPAYVPPGGTISYSLRTQYPGTEPLENVRLFDPIPTGTSYLPGSVNAGGTFGFYTPLPAEPGNDPEGGPAGTTTLDSAVGVSGDFVNVGGTVTVMLNVKQNSGSAVSGVEPTDFTVKGGAFTILSGPTPASASVPTGATGVTFVWEVRLDGPGEYDFSVGAANAAETFVWPAATSASVLSAANGGPNVVSWNLGSTVPRVPAETIVSGAPAGIYGFRGRGTPTFSRFGLTSLAWSGRANFGGGNVQKGGALTTDACRRFTPSAATTPSASTNMTPSPTPGPSWPTPAPTSTKAVPWHSSRSVALIMSTP
jgi:uncharacterized repeat protein (TIGR01451 family)